MNNLVAKIAYKIIFVATVLLAISHLSAQSTPKVGITQLIGCGTGTNANKAQIQVAVEGAGYTYNFGPDASDINGNTAWVPAGTRNVIVTQGSKTYTLPITVPAKATAPTFTTSVVYNGDNNTANVTLSNNQPTYQYSYTYGGSTKSNPYFTNLTSGTHSVSVTYIAPSTTKSVVFYDDFGKKTDATKSVQSPYINRNVYFDPMNGSNQTRPADGHTRPKTVADSYYAIGNRTDMMAGTYGAPPALSYNWVLPNDKDGDMNGRYLWYNANLDNDPPGEKNTVYKRKAKVTPGLPVEFSAYLFNPINPNEPALAGYQPNISLKIFRSEADFNSNTPMYSSDNTDAIQRQANGDNWTRISVTTNTRNTDTELIFVIYINNGGNDLCVDNILVTQPSKTCPITQVVPIIIGTNTNPITFTSTTIYNCIAKNANITVNPSVTTGHTYTYTLDGGTPQSSNTFSNIPLGAQHTITITSKRNDNKIIFKEDFGSGGTYLMPTSVIPPPFVGRLGGEGYPSDIPAEGNYQIANKNNLVKRSSWNWENPSDHTSNGSDSNGRYLAFNYGKNANKYFYSQDIQVTANKKVTIEYYVYNLNKHNAGDNSIYYPNIQVSFVDKASGNVINAATKASGGVRGHDNTKDWKHFTHTFTSGNATNLQVRFTNLTDQTSGNDFAIDDILITQEQDIYNHTQTVTINPVAEVTSVTATPIVFRQGTSTTVTFTITGTPNAQITYAINGANTQTATLNSTGKYTVTTVTTQATEINVNKVKLGACEYSYTDKKAKVVTSLADCISKPLSQFPKTPVNGQTAKNLMNGVTVTRSYSGTPKVYSGDTDTYCSGSTYDDYTIIHTNPAFSPKVIYTFSQPITSAEVWLMIMGSPRTVNDKVKLSTNNGTPTFTKVYDCAEGKGQAGATLNNGEVTSQPNIVTDVAVRVTSNSPFTQLIVEDINGTNSSGVLVELCPTSITPAETISITTQPQNQTICADKKATFTSKAQLKDATGNIQYKWQQSSNGATWTDIPASTGAIASGGTASLTIDGTTNYKYRVVYSYQFAQGIVVTATSQEATLTKLPSVALPTLITGSKTLCPTATNNRVSFANYVTAPTGTTLLWYTAPTATVSSTTAPVINTHVTTRTIQTAYVRALSTTGCTSGIVTVTLTVDDTTAPTFTAPTPLNIVCNSTTATTAINNWLGTATATDACGAIATITNNYTAPANLCNVAGGLITVTFVAKDTFGNTQTRTSTIHLGVTPLVVKDDSFTVPDGLRTQTTISVLDNDSLGGTKPTAGAGGTVTITNVVPATPINGGKVPTLDPNTGVVTIPANTPAGIYTITYKECEALNPSSNCKTATAEIKVGTPTITVTPETLTVTPSTATQTIPNILNNDKIGGTVTPTVGVGGNVTLTVTNPNTPGKKPTLDPNTGEVTIPGNTPAGTYTITYSYCEVLNPTNCTGTQTLVVTVGAATLTVQNDSFTVPDGLTTQTTISVLDNDQLNGTKPTAGVGGTVTITNVTGATPINGGKVPTLDPSTGVVTIPANTPAGIYTITYKECEALNPSSNCRTATAEIKVGTPTITVTPDPITVTPSTVTRTIPNILNNDKIGGTVTPTVGVGGNVTLTVTNPNTPGKKPTLDPNTGEVTIPGNTPAGTYTITYSYCEVLNPTNCTGTQTLVVTVGAATLTVVNDSFIVPDGLTTQTTISVLDNDRLNGTKPTAGVGGTVTITNVTGATPVRPGTNVPTLNPNDGKVTIPANTPAGIYTITYKECETLNPSSNCRTATAEIKVGTPTITVTPDPITVTPSTVTRTIPNILNNDKIGGTVTPTVGVGGNVTLTVTNPIGTKVPTLDRNTGEVTIPGNTPAGTYTITYSYCEVLNPTNCTGTQTLVVTVGGTVTPTALPVAVEDRASTAMNTPINIAVLANDTLNGATTPNVVTSPANGTVVVNADNTVEYRPHTGFAGTDTFVYEICNSAGCSSATVTIDIVNKIVPYNGMSVDGDGKNDYFHIGGIENYPNNVVRIYNRWGVKVFEVSGYDNVTRVFKGISDGRVTVEAPNKLPQGTYYYVIEYYDQNNNKQSEVGWLYLKK